MLHLFYGYHFYLIWKGHTTNESIKYGNFEYTVEKSKLVFEAVLSGELKMTDEMAEDYGLDKKWTHK